MRVHVGASWEESTNNWRKSDVELDETDLARLLHAKDINLDEVSPRIKPALAFIVLHTEGEKLIFVGAATADKSNIHLRQKLADAKAEADKALDTLIGSLK